MKYKRKTILDKILYFIFLDKHFYPIVRFILRLDIRRQINNTCKEKDMILIKIDDKYEKMGVLDIVLEEAEKYSGLEYEIYPRDRSKTYSWTIEKGIEEIRIYLHIKKPSLETSKIVLKANIEGSIRKNIKLEYKKLSSLVRFNLNKKEFKKLKKELKANNNKIK